MSTPASASPPGASPPEIERPRKLGELLGTTFALWRAHFGALTAIAVGVVVVVDLIAGAGLGELTARYHASATDTQNIIELLIWVLVTTPLVSAAIARLVLGVARGRRPTAWSAISEGLELFAPVLVVVLIYAVAVVAGSFLVVPAIYFAVTLYFVTQAVAIDGLRGLEAARRSAELVRGNWWRLLGIGLVFQLIAGIVVAPLVTLADSLARAADAEAIQLLGNMLAQVIQLSFLGLGATLTFFELRARQAALSAPADLGPRA